MCSTAAGSIVSPLVLLVAGVADIGADVVAIVAILVNVSLVGVDVVLVMVATSAAIAENPDVFPMRSVRLAEMRAPRRRGQELPIPFDRFRRRGDRWDRRRAWQGPLRVARPYGIGHPTLLGEHCPFRVEPGPQHCSPA
jgi:hypothetical protein